MFPLLSVATMWITSVPDCSVPPCSVSVRCARTVFTRASEPDKVTTGPLVTPITVPVRPAKPSVPPASELSVTL